MCIIKIDVICIKHLFGNDMLNLEPPACVLCFFPLVKECCTQCDHCRRCKCNNYEHLEPLHISASCKLVNHKCGEENTNVWRERIPDHTQQLRYYHLRVMLINQFERPMVGRKSSFQQHFISFLHFRPLLPCSICFEPHKAQRICRPLSEVPHVFLLRQCRRLQS